MTERYQDLLRVLGETKDNDTVVIKARPKARGVVSVRGSKYRGVSKNGKKWQVSLSYIISIYSSQLSSDILLLVFDRSKFFKICRRSIRDRSELSALQPESMTSARSLRMV